MLASKAQVPRKATPGIDLHAVEKLCGGSKEDGG